MNSEDILKITYHLGSQKKVNYMYTKGKDFLGTRSYISNWLFNELAYPKCEIRLFWIDDENDEVDILNDQDLLFFNTNYPSLTKRNRHLHVTSVDERKDETVNVETAASSNSTSNQTQVPSAEGSYEFAVHHNVECDNCMMAPIVGFRYKCIECPNYDLCQNCESKHVHSEHMMVRMPTNNCPSVVDAYITRDCCSRRKHGKRSKTSCPLVKNGLSNIIDDKSGESSTAGNGDKNSEQPTPSNGKERSTTHGRRHRRRHHRNNILAHLYEMMHDLAEGGGAAAAAYAVGEEASSSTKTTTATSAPHATTSHITNKEKLEKENEANIIAAQNAAQQSLENAVKAVKIASKVVNENFVKASETASAAQTDANSVDKEATKDKVDATTSPREGSNSITPSFEALAQILDPQYMKTGLQILNNFSDMFAKILDPMDIDEGSNKPASTCTFNTNLRKNSTTSTKSSVSSNRSDKDCVAKELEKEKSLENQKNKESYKIYEEEDSDTCNIEIEDIGSDSESDSISESFIKVVAPNESNTNKSATANTSAQTTPPQSLNKSNVMDFAQLSSDLKAHIAAEAVKNASPSIETGIVATEQMTNTKPTLGEPVVTTTTTATATTTTTNEEMRAVPVYHANENINNAVQAMMAMGFSNEGAWLTQLLESVNGNIPEALDLMSVAQR